MLDASRPPGQHIHDIQTTLEKQQALYSTEACQTSRLLVGHAICINSQFAQTRFIRKVKEKAEVAACHTCERLQILAQLDSFCELPCKICAMLPKLIKGYEPYVYCVVSWAVGRDVPVSSPMTRT